MSWFTNPFHHPWLLSLCLPLLCLFLLATITLVFIQFTPILTLSGQLTTDILWQRYRTWLSIAVLYFGAILCGPLTLALLTAFLIYQGAREYVTLTELESPCILLISLGGLLTLLSLLFFGTPILPFAPILAFFASSLIALFAIERGLPLEKGISLAVLGFWGYLYIAWLPAHLLALALGHFPMLLITLGLGVALSDIAAFCFGKFFNGPKLAPRLSPSKTWTGLLGNICGAFVAVLLTRSFLPDFSLWQILVLTLLIAFGSVWGDLLESLLKRYHGVKDAGAFLPGFGGLLDRIDSLLLVAPLLYYFSPFFHH